MNLPDREIFPNPFGEEPRRSTVISVSRQEMLESDAFSAVEGMPDFLTNALRRLAGDSSAKGFAVLASEYGHIINILHEPPKRKRGGVYAAEHELTAIALGLQGVGVEWVDMKGRAFEDVEKDIRGGVPQNPGTELAGIIRFSD